MTWLSTKKIPSNLPKKKKKARITEFSKVVRYKINMQKSVVFLYIVSEHVDTQKYITIYNHPIYKGILRCESNKRVGLECRKLQNTDEDKDLNKCTDSHVHGLEDSRCQFSRNWYTSLMKILARIFVDTDKTILKLTWKHTGLKVAKAILKKEESGRNQSP